MSFRKPEYNSNKKNKNARGRVVKMKTQKIVKLKENQFVVKRKSQQFTIFSIAATIIVLKYPS